MRIYYKFMIFIALHIYVCLPKGFDVNESIIKIGIFMSVLFWTCNSWKNNGKMAECCLFTKYSYSICTPCICIYIIRDSYDCFTILH